MNNTKAIISILVIILLIVNLLGFAMNLISVFAFWIVLSACALFSYILPKISENKK